MGLTLIEKILLNHSSERRLADFVYAKVDFAFANDITGPLAVGQFYKTGRDKISHPDKISFICDHFTPAKDAKAANNVVLLRDFSRRFKIKNFFVIGITLQFRSINFQIIFAFRIWY